ncbi:MAG: LysM peptidoglycan-binding domain-containing protein [Bacteroidota bacterium]
MNRLLLGILFIPWWLPWVLESEPSSVQAPPAAFATNTTRVLPTAPLSLPWSASAQLDRYPFLQLDRNRILNQNQSIAQVYELLRQVEAGERRTINIVHIGDSHLQADWFSGHVRMALHRRFGSAGRGLIFPYKLANTNSPPDIHVATNIRWNTRRNINRSGSLPIGISGITAHTNQRNYALDIALDNNEFDINYAFNKITFFTDKGPRNYDLSLTRKGAPAPAPAPSALSSPQKVMYHEVKAGENLTLISRKYRISIGEIQRLNHLKDATIYAGQKLLIKSESVVPRTKSVQVPGLGGELASVRLSSHSLTPFTSTVYLDNALEAVTRETMIRSGLSSRNWGKK